MTAPTVIPTASAINALPARGISLFLMKPACVARPIIVPAVSKKVTSKKVTTTVTICSELMSPMCVTPAPKVGAKEGAEEISALGSLIRPKMMHG